MVLCLVYLFILFIIEELWQIVVLIVGCKMYDLLMFVVYLCVDLLCVDEVFEVKVECLKVLVYVCCNLCGEMNVLLVQCMFLLVVGGGVDIVVFVFIL